MNISIGEKKVFSGAASHHKQLKDYRRCVGAWHDPPKRVYMGVHTRLKWRHMGESEKWAAWTCTKPTSGYNLSILIRARVPRCALTLNNLTKQVYTGTLKRPARMSLHSCPWMTHLNKFTWIPSNSQPEQVYVDALKRPTQTSLHWRPHMIETKAQGRARKMRCTNVHKAHPESHPRIFDTGSCDWACPHSEQADQTSLHGRTSLHGHPRMTRSKEFTRAPWNDLPERIYMGTLKRPTQMSLHRYPQMTTWMSLHRCPHDQNKGTKESQENELHERAQIPPWVTT